MHVYQPQLPQNLTVSYGFILREGLDNDCSFDEFLSHPSALAFPGCLVSSEATHS